MLRGVKWGPWVAALLAVIGAAPWPAKAEAESRATHAMRYLIPPTWALIPALALLVFGLYREAYLNS